MEEIRINGKFVSVGFEEYWTLKKMLLIIIYV